MKEEEYDNRIKLLEGEIRCNEEEIEVMERELYILYEEKMKKYPIKHS